MFIPPERIITREIINEDISETALDDMSLSEVQAFLAEINEKYPQYTDIFIEKDNGIHLEGELTESDEDYQLRYDAAKAIYDAEQAEIARLAAEEAARLAAKEAAAKAAAAKEAARLARLAANKKRAKTKVIKARRVRSKPIFSGKNDIPNIVSNKRLRKRWKNERNYSKKNKW